MIYHQQIVDAIVSLTDRYGITLIEVPDRLRDKILVITGQESAAEVDLLLAPLRNNMLRPLRLRAGNKVTEEVVAEVRHALSGLDGYSSELANESVNIWLKIFKVKIGKMLYESEVSEQFANFNSSLDYKTNLSIITDASVEKVTNQFDNTTFFDEPTIAAYDGKFADESFEKVADFSISDEENLLIEGVVGFKAETPPGAHAPSSGKNKPETTQPKLAKKKKTETPPIEPDQMASSGSCKYTLDDAFKELRNSNFEMASKIMMELARAGDTRAQFHLGEFYSMGTGVELNVEKAKYWFKKAASRGSIPAKNKLLDLESSEGGTGCLGCAATVFVVIVVLKFLGAMI